MLIEGERIVDVVSVAKSAEVSALMMQYADWNPVDLEDYYISPGLVDLNTRRDFESLASMTKTALKGGVTLVLDEEFIITSDCDELYVDVAKAKIAVDNFDIEDWSHALAIKCYLFPPNSSLGSASDIDEIAKSALLLNKLLIIDPLLPEDRMMYMASPMRAFSNENRLEGTIEPNDRTFPAGFPHDIHSDNEDTQPETTLAVTEKPKVTKASLDGLSPKQPSIPARFSIEMPYYRADHNIYTDLQKRINEIEASTESISKVEQRSYGQSGQTHFSSLYTPSPAAEASTQISPDRSSSGRLARFRPKPVAVEKSLVRPI